MIISALLRLGEVEECLRDACFVLGIAGCIEHSFKDRQRLIFLTQQHMGIPQLFQQIEQQIGRQLITTLLFRQERLAIIAYYAVYGVEPMGFEPSFLVVVECFHPSFRLKIVIGQRTDDVLSRWKPRPHLCARLRFEQVSNLGMQMASATWKLVFIERLSDEAVAKPIAFAARVYRLNQLRGQDFVHLAQ